MVMPADSEYQEVSALLSWHEVGGATWRGPAPKDFLEQHCAAHKVGKAVLLPHGLMGWSRLSAVLLTWLQRVSGRPCVTETRVAAAAGCPLPSLARSCSADMPTLAPTAAAGPLLQRF